MVSGLEDIMRVYFVLAGVAVLSACAKAPASIVPAYISEVGYLNWTCEQLATETTRMSAAYASAAKQQEQARTNDVVGVILIGLPVSSMSGDNIAPEIARLKGEQEAIRKAMMAKQCSPAMIPPAEAAKPKGVKKTPSEG